MSLDRNIYDLRRHAADFGARSGFTFTVLEPVTGDVIGCSTSTPRSLTAAYRGGGCRLGSRWSRTWRQGPIPAITKRQLDGRLTSCSGYFGAVAGNRVE